MYSHNRKTHRGKYDKWRYILILFIFAVLIFSCGIYVAKNIMHSKKVSPAASTDRKNTQSNIAPALPKLEILPELENKWIKIVKAEHKLYVVQGKDKIIASYRVAVGRNTGQKQKSGDCRTPEGRFSVQTVQSAKGWSHDFKDGKGVIKNAYGPWFIRLKTGWNGIGIHGTHDPKSIGENITEGCIRMHNEDLAELKNKFIELGMTVVIE